jgi:hypothetical protein
MIITRNWKGGPHDHYNSFMSTPIESVAESDAIELNPDPDYNFKKEIKDDFFV